MNNLFLKIDEVTATEEDIFDFCGTICELSRHPATTSALIDALIDAVEEKERQWQEIERREDYQARYQNRVEARRDFLKQLFSKEEEIK